MPDQTTAVEGKIPIPRRVRNFAEQLYSDSLLEWRLPSRLVRLIWLSPMLIGLVGAVTALMGKAAYKLFTGEDKIAENLQVILWVITLALTIKLIGRLRQMQMRLILVLYALLALGIVFLIGEEISWGQRIFGWETSETLKAINKQQETNIHNIHGIGTMFKYFHLVIGLYGTILPLAFRRMHFRSPEQRAAFQFLVPPLALLTSFLAALLWRIQATFWKPPKSLYFVVTEFSEVIELIIAVAFTVFSYYQYSRTAHSD